MIARGAGISNAFRYDDLAVFGREIRRLLKAQGPVFVVLDVDPDASHVSGKQFGKVRARDTFYNRQFRQALMESSLFDAQSRPSSPKQRKDGCDQ